MCKQSTRGFVKRYRICTEGVDVAAPEAVEVRCRWVGIAELEDDFVARSLRFWFPSRFADFCHCKTPDSELCFLIFQVVWVGKVHEVEGRLG